MMRTFAKYRTVSALLLLSVVVSLHYNNFANLHSHVLDNGQRITHSHPVQDSEKDHSHTAEELVWLEMISHPKFTNVALELSVIDCLSNAITPALAIYKPMRYTIQAVRNCSLRGPPTLLA